jgi:hypothetical protein
MPVPNEGKSFLIDRDRWSGKIWLTLTCLRLAGIYKFGDTQAKWLLK